MLNSYGQLEVSATKADGALPVEGASVRITGAEEDNRFVVYLLKTDLDGNTKAVSLPTPKKDISMHPGATEMSYAIYDVEVTAEGYYPKIIRSVPVFSGIKSIQPVNMIPLSESDPLSDYPYGNLSTITEDMHLN